MISNVHKIIDVGDALSEVPGLTNASELSKDFGRPQSSANFESYSVTILPGTPPNALALLSALRRRYKIALGIGPILGLIIAVVAWLLIPSSKYTARALLQVASSQPKFLFSTEENRVDFSTYQKTQLTLIKSRKILKKALDDPQVVGLEVVRKQVDPILWLEKQIQAEFMGEVFRISMSGNNPDELACLVNAVRDAYVMETVDFERKERETRKDELQRIYDDYQQKLEQRRKELRELARKVGSRDKQTIRYTQELAIERQSTVRRELLQIQSDLRSARAELEIWLAHDRATPAPSVVMESSIRPYLDEDAEIKRLESRIVQLEASIARVGRVARDASDPSMQANQRELATTRKALASRVTSVRAHALEQIERGKPDAREFSVMGLRDRIGVLEELAKVTQAVFDAESAEAQEISQDTLYIDTIQDQISHADSAAKRIGEELEILSVELKAPSRVRKIEDANAPRKDDDKRVLFAGAAGLGTFGIFVLGVAFLEFRARRITSVEEVSQGLGLRVMGALPTVRKQGQLPAGSDRQADPYGGNLLTESIDSIRTMILHSTGQHALRSIMVTSASSGEGKTSLACHLATSLARAGMKTLLIDCDLRKPTIHRLYDVLPTPGFSEFLRGEVDASEVIRTTTVDGPDIIAAGACDASTLRALAQAPTGRIFDVFRGSHDIIVVDTSPILPVTDGLIVGRHVDAAVYSILRDVSRLPWTLAALGRLKSLNIRILGAVVTGVRSQVYGPYNDSHYVGGSHHG